VTRLIVNADDFGLTPGINQSIFELCRRRALTSATMMATADCTAAAATGAIQAGLGIGCHVVLVDGKPALSHENLPALTLPSGIFRPTLGELVFDLMRGNIPEMEIEMEAVAQIRSLQAMGVRVTHLDTHKHTHIFPRVLRPLLRAAVVCGVHAVRNPFEPDWAIIATPHAPTSRRVQVNLLHNLRGKFLRLVKQAGVTTTDGAIGVLATGTLDPDTIQSLLKAMPEGTWELVCHPGYVDQDLNSIQTRLRESRAIEHTALVETVPAFLNNHPEITMINFEQIYESTT